jgi:hypothetical protein
MIACGDHRDSRLKELLCQFRRDTEPPRDIFAIRNHRINLTLRD